MQEKSLFTKIIEGEIPAHKIYEDDRVIAILDIHPINDGHTLVILKKQIDHLWDLDDDDYHYLLDTSKKIAKHIKNVMDSPRVGMIVDGFGVPHVHIHLIPIYSGTDIIKRQPDAIPDEKLAEIARKLEM